MAQQSLKARENAIILDELRQEVPDGKVTIRAARDRLKSRGRLTGDIDEYELEETRHIIHGARKFRSSNDEVQLELLHFTETLEDGTVSPYYKTVEDTTFEEAISYMELQSRSVSRERRKFSKYHEAFKVTHGRRYVREIQTRLNLLDFMPPPNPVAVGVPG